MSIPSEDKFRQWMNIVSQEINIIKNSFTVRVVETTEIQALNKQFRGKDSPTNVLSFPAHLPEYVDDQYLGDVIICADIVEHEAKAQNKSLQAHWAHMLVHGILHLQGYDHIAHADASEMETLEIHLLAQLGYSNPYEA